MHAILIGVTWGLVGLDWGSIALPGGGVEFIIQIAPHEMDVFIQEKIIQVDVEAQLRDIRALRVVIGNDLLPRQAPAKTAATAASLPGPAFSPDLALPPWAKRASARYNPFAALSSWAERYPFTQGSAADDAKRTGDKPSGGTTASAGHSKPGDKAAKDSRPTPKEPAKPWLPFTVAVIALFGSLGGNLYLGWIAWETRRRYRALLRRRKKVEQRRMEKTDESDISDE